MSEIEIYTTATCPFCIMARHLLTRKGLSYHEIDVASDSEVKATMIRRSGRRTVPQIFIDAISIGGFDELAALEASGELDRILAD